MKRALLLAPLLLAGVAAVAPAQSQIPVSAFSNTYSYVSHTRGFWFVAPKDFIVTSVQVPDETKHGQQNVAVYNQGLITTPTTATAAHLKFYKTGQPSNVPQACNVYFKANELFAVLGACGDTTTMHNSYGTGGFASNVLGSPVTLQRLTLQANLIASAGLGALGNGGTGSIARVFVTVVPPKGLFPDFEADRTEVASGTKVTFKDKTYTSDPGGVKTWAWDFNGDNVVDSTVQNPSFAYPYAGKTTTYDVSLTVTDAVTPGGKSLTKKAYITVDPPPVADFDATPRVGGAPLIVQFTDRSVGANKWAWDFNGDNVTDSTVQNPKFGFAPGTFSVKLTASNAGGSDTVTKANYIRALKPGETAQTVPAGYLTTEGPSSTSYAWGRYNSALGHRIQYCYDRSNITSKAPVVINYLRFRANADPTRTWSGGVHKNVTIQLSTCPTTPSGMGTTFASNQGADNLVVYNGDVVVKPQLTPDPNSPRLDWFVEVKLQKPFTYNPSKGDLLFDLTMPGPLNLTLSTETYYPDYATTGGYYVYSYSDASAVTGSGPYAGAMVIELTYTKAAGLYPDFSVDRTAGLAPLKVQFTDTTYSSSPGGVTTWAWDFNGDNVIDSTVQNPLYIYNPTAVTTYDVKLTVTDTANPGGKSITKTKLITVVPAGSPATQPDLLQYQFNEARGGLVANTASGATYPAQATVTGTTVWQKDSLRPRYMAPFKGTGCLGNSGHVNTGGPINIKGDMTIMFWFRMHTSPGSTLDYFFGDGTFRCFCNGVAGNSFWFRGTGIGDIKATFDVVTVTNKWIHCALVIDDKAGTATWYFNGIKDTTTNITPNSFSYSGTGNFTVGSNGGSSVATVHYDMDDFRLYNKAIIGPMVIAEMGQEIPSAGMLDKGCNNALIAGGGIPRLNTPTFAIKVANAPASAGGAMLIGTSPLKFMGTINLPWDISFLLGPGCMLQTHVILVTSFATDPTGAATLPFPIPGGALFEGAHLYAQGLIVGSSMAATPGLDINIQK